MAQRDAAVNTLGPLLDERTRLIKLVVQTLTELNSTATNSFGAADPAPPVLAAADPYKKKEMSTNDALIRGTLESHRAELDNAVKIHHTATNPMPPATASGPVMGAPQGVSPLPAAEEEHHPLQLHPP